MRVVIQRSLESSVIVNKKTVGKIDSGLVILVGFDIEDTIEDLKYIVRKIVNLRIFDDDFNIMNKSIKDVSKDILSISQFTLLASTKDGNRPSYTRSLNRDKSIELYKEFNNLLRNEQIRVEEGIFGADMTLNITNDGPVTIIIDSKDK